MDGAGSWNARNSPIASSKDSPPGISAGGPAGSRSRAICDDEVFEVRVVRREFERPTVVGERLVLLAPPVVDVGQPLQRRQVLRRGVEHPLQLVLRLLQLPHLDQRPAERHVRRQVARMVREAGPAGLDRLLEAACPAVFFGELREGNRRLVLLDSASKLFDARVFSHGSFLLTDAHRPVVVAVRPAESVMVRRTTNEPAVAKIFDTFTAEPGGAVSEVPPVGCR